MSSTRNRVIYAGNTVLVSDYPSYSGQTGEYSLKLLKRIQSSSISISNPVSRAKQIGSSDFSFERYLQSPQIQASLNYLITDNSNELLLGFNATGNEGFLKNLKPAGRDRNLFFLLSNDGGQDANSITSFSGIDIFSLGNCFPTNYSLNAEVGSVPSASIDFDCLNMVFQNYQSGVSQVPAIILESGTKSTGLFYVSSKNLNQENYLTNQDLRVSALKPGDIEMQLEQPIMGGIRYSGVVPALINSVQISVPIERKDLLGFGSNYPYDKKIVYPVVGTLSFNGTFDEAVTGDFSSIFQDTNSYNFKFNFKTPSGTTGYRVEIQNAKVENQNFDLSIGENMSFSSEFSFKIFEQDGFRVSGTSLFFEPSFDFDPAGLSSFSSRIGAVPSFSRASSGSRINSSGLIEFVSNNTPRIDFNPQTLSCNGLLIEEQRSNTIRKSDSISGSSWSNIDCAYSGILDQSPRLGLNSYTVLYRAAGFAAGRSGLRYYTGGNHLNANGVGTASVFIKKIFGQSNLQAMIHLQDVSNTGIFGYLIYSFDSDTLLAGNDGAANQGTLLSYGRYFFPNGWIRIWVTFQMGTRPVNLVGVYATALNSRTNWSPTQPLAIGVFGFQTENNYGASSYITTDDVAPITRSADVCSLTGSNFSSVWDPNKGAIIVNAMRDSTLNASGSNGLPMSLAISNGTSLNDITILGNAATNKEEIKATYTGLNTASISFSPVSEKTPYKIGMTYGIDNYVGCLNGGLASYSNQPNLVPSVNSASIGYHSGIANRYQNGHIGRITFYKQRLTESQLKLFTS